MPRLAYVGYAGIQASTAWTCSGKCHMKRGKLFQVPRFKLVDAGPRNQDMATYIASFGKHVVIEKVPAGFLSGAGTCRAQVAPNPLFNQITSYSLSLARSLRILVVTSASQSTRFLCWCLYFFDTAC